MPTYLWIKAFHVIFVVTWFAGLFYLPRLFVYHASADDEPSRERFGIMEKRLFAIMTIGASLATVLGLTLWVLNPILFETGWFRIKLVLLAGLIAYHVHCWKLIGDFRAGKNTRTHKWYRWYNEVPTLFLIAIVVLAIVKPH